MQNCLKYVRLWLDYRVVVKTFSGSNIRTQNNLSLIPPWQGLQKKKKKKKNIRASLIFSSTFPPLSSWLMGRVPQTMDLLYSKSMPKPKLSMFVHSQTFNTFPEQTVRESQNCITSSVGPTDLELLIKTCKILCWSRITWPTNILMPFFSSSDNSLQAAYIIFPKSFSDNFEIIHKSYSILVLGALAT